MAKRTNSMAGTIQRGSVKHLIYEAMMAHKSDTFTAQEIYDKTTKKNPDIQKHSVQNMVGFVFVRMKIVKKTDRVKEAKDSGRKLKIYERIATAKQPVIREPGIGPAKKPRKTTPKKTNEANPNLTALEMGESMIDYINHLQARVGVQAIELDEANKTIRTQGKELERKLDALQYKYVELGKAHEALKTQIKQSSKGRAFDTSAILDFKQRKAMESGGR